METDVTPAVLIGGYPPVFEGDEKKAKPSEVQLLTSWIKLSDIVNVSGFHINVKTDTEKYLPITMYSDENNNVLKLEVIKNSSSSKNGEGVVFTEDWNAVDFTCDVNKLLILKRPILTGEITARVLKKLHPDYTFLFARTSKGHNDHSVSSMLMSSKNWLYADFIVNVSVNMGNETPPLKLEYIRELNKRIIENPVKMGFSMHKGATQKEDEHIPATNTFCGTTEKCAVM